jgi:hypothetical protein
MMAEQMLNGSAQRVIAALITAAEKGDVAAATFIVRRLLPARRGCPITIDGLPPISKADDVAVAISAIIHKVAAGELTLDEATAATAIFDVQRRAFETASLEQRLAAIEKTLEQQRR